MEGLSLSETISDAMTETSPPGAPEPATVKIPAPPSIRTMGASMLIEPPTPDQGARRVWADSHGRIWVSEWKAGQLSVFDPADESWRSWRLPGDRPRAYAVFVDDTDTVWLSDFGANAIIGFDPERERFTAFPSDRAGARVRQILGRPGEVWAPESGTDRLVVIRTN